MATIPLSQAKRRASSALRALIRAAEEYLQAEAELRQRGVHAMQAAAPKAGVNEETTDELLRPLDVDVLLRYSYGRSKRLARRGLLPFLTLPDGEIRFRQSDINGIIAGNAPATLRKETP